jgi:hypothetical protein
LATLSNEIALISIFSQAAIHAQDSWNTEERRSKVVGGLSVYDKTDRHHDEETAGMLCKAANEHHHRLQHLSHNCLYRLEGKRHKSWHHAPENPPVESFPAFYIGSSMPYPVDFLYATDDHMPAFPVEAEASANAGMVHGSYSSFRLANRRWGEQPHEYHGHLATSSFPELQVHSFAEDGPLSTGLDGIHDYPQWVYPPRTQQFPSVTPNPFASESNTMYYGVENRSLLPASNHTSPPYFHSQQDIEEAVAEVESPPRDFSKSTTTSLYLACDAESLSEYQCLIRKQIELFSATYSDIEMTVQGRNRKIHAGQVGVRCRHCADIPIKKRARGAVYYPSKLSCIYQAAQNMSSVHLVKHCTRVPASIRAELMKKDRKSSAGSGKEYWAVGARSMGIIEIDGRLWYESDAPASWNDTVSI